MLLPPLHVMSQSIKELVGIQKPKCVSG